MNLTLMMMRMRIQTWEKRKFEWEDAVMDGRLRTVAAGHMSAQCRVSAGFVMLISTLSDHEQTDNHCRSHKILLLDNSCRVVSCTEDCWSWTNQRLVCLYQPIRDEYLPGSNIRLRLCLDHSRIDIDLPQLWLSVSILTKRPELTNTIFLKILAQSSWVRWRWKLWKIKKNQTFIIGVNFC